MKYYLISIVFLLAMSGCGNDDAPASKAVYFDLKAYLAGEISRLKSQNPEVEKTVMVNGSAETRKLRISDWNKELSAFSDADLNKAAWKGLFIVSKAGDTEIYQADEEKVPVKELRVTRTNNRVSAVRVLLRTRNSLYTSTDTLSYVPDSLYEVRKSQEIRLLNRKNYRITGLFKH